MQNLFDEVKWSTVPIPAGAANGTIDLTIGEVGTGSPITLITAGVHGDEGPWGVLAIKALLSQTPYSSLIGTLRIIPTANPLAMQADARNAPLDVLDLNRVFPGNANGSHTEVLAARLVENALDSVDYVIDLHGGGSWCVNSFVFRFKGGELLADAFRAPFVVNAPERDVTLTGYARTKGASVCALEMGGRSEVELSWAQRIASGLNRALIEIGVLNGKIQDDATTKSQEVSESTVIRPSQGGIFVPELRTDALGTIVDEGTLLGQLLDTGTMRVIEEFRAPFAKTCMLLLRPTVTRIEGGAMTYVVAQPITAQ